MSSAAAPCGFIRRSFGKGEAPTFIDSELLTPSLLTTREQRALHDHSCLPTTPCLLPT